MAKERTESFEQIYARLEETVAKLEQGGLPLEESIALFEAGMDLARRCQERLDQADLKITQLRESFASLSRNGGRLQEELQDYEYVEDDESPTDDEPLA